MLGLITKLLAVETAGDKIRAAVVRKMGKTFEILDFVVLPRTETTDDLPMVEEIKTLGERLQFTTGKVVFVTPMARTFDLIMDRAKVKGLKNAQLKAAVKWEVEPFTGISGNNALIGVEVDRMTVLSPEDPGYGDDDAPVTVSVSAMERNIHRAVKARFKVAGFNLLRVYPPDVTFYAPLFMDNLDIPRAILEVGQDYSNFAILKGRVPEQISTLSLSLESITAHLSGEIESPELEESLRFTVRQVPPPEALIVSGEGAAVDSVMNYIDSFCSNGAVPLSLSRSAGITDLKDDPENAAFANVVGAAVRELAGRAERVMGIDDSEDLLERLKKSAYLVPLVTSMAMAVLLFGHYEYMKYKEKDYKAQIAELGEDLKERKARIAEYEQLIQKDNTLKKGIEFAGKRLDYITTEADKDIVRIVRCLKGIGAAVSASVVLDGIVQDDKDGTYTVTGTSSDMIGVSRFFFDLQNMRWCESAALSKMEKKGGEDDLVQFEVKVKPKKDNL